MTEPILSESNPVCKAVCPNCHKELNGRYQVKYCSKRCALDYRIKKGIEKNTKNCPVCNKVFIAKIGHRQDSPGHKNEGRYCSNKCKWIGKRIDPELKKHQCSCKIYFKKCLGCGAMITVKRKDQEYCSPECYVESNRLAERERSFRNNASKKQIVNRSCKECEIDFTPEYGDKRRNFCSLKCSARYISRGSNKNRKRARKHGVEYEYTNANKVFDRDGWRCQICGKTTPKARRGSRYPNAPEIDHRVPISKGGNHLYSNIQCACRACNSKKSNYRTVGQLPLFNIIK